VPKAQAAKAKADADKARTYADPRRPTTTRRRPTEATVQAELDVHRHHASIRDLLKTSTAGRPRTMPWRQDSL